MRYARECDFVFHLAGVNRPADEADFVENEAFTVLLIKKLRQSGNPVPVLYASSAQAALDNPYGRSKRAAEDLLFAYGEEANVPVFIYRLPGVFGKWCRPNYNSVVATFCDAAVHGHPLCVNDDQAQLTLAHVDDVVEEMTAALTGNANRNGSFCEVGHTFTTTVGKLADCITAFRTGRNQCAVADMADELTARLYSTYISYLSEDDFAYPLNTHQDSRGLFAEFLKSGHGGQVSINICKPGITKGNHYHHVKVEKILVVSGEGVLHFQKLGGGPVLDYHVSAERPTVVEIPPGYIHSVENTGTADMTMVIWSSQVFDPGHPDTYPALIQR
jgi:UDP-2-acetamido-2,6-beta-L-arabino-hexul-4-ose reductase